MYLSVASTIIVLVAPCVTLNGVCILQRRYGKGVCMLVCILLDTELRPQLNSIYVNLRGIYKVTVKG